MGCTHPTVQCLNQYEFMRKYRCQDCGKVLICTCEEKMALTFLPHQVSFGCELESQHRVSVDGFAPQICAECRGESETPHPLAKIWGQKGKVERFYWREITKTYYQLLLDHYGNEFPFKSIVEHDAQCPDETRELQTQAKQIWQQRHKVNPKYDTRERTQAEFLAAVSVPVREIAAPYQQIERAGQQVGKWLTDSGELLSAEELVADWYRDQGYEVLRCERKLVSIWVATFLGAAILDPADPNSATVMRHSTLGWTPASRDTPMITFNLPEDFGALGYYERRRQVVDSWLIGMRTAQDLTVLYDALLNDTVLIRDYLWVVDDVAVQLGRRALQIVPKQHVVAAVEWTIKDFWSRQPGWPDLLISTKDGFRFSEVKSPHDRLSQDQMNWFEWAVGASIPCELVRVKRRS